MRQIIEVLKNHDFLKDLDSEMLQQIAGCGAEQAFSPGDMIGREGENADFFYILLSGKIAIQIFHPSKGAITVQTVGANEILGWSWLFPPYRWCFDMKVIEPTTTIALDGRCLRGKCESDHDLGYALMKKFSHIMIQRLHSTRLQILDVYQGASH